MWLTLLSAALAQEIPEEEQLPGDFEELPAEAPAPAWEPKLQVSAGPGVGAAIPLRTELAGAAQVSADVGVQLPVWGGRLRPLALLAITNPAYTGHGEDPQLPSAYTYTLHQRELTAGVGIGIRALKGNYPVNPELIAAPQLYLMRSTLDTTMGSTSLGSSAESTTALGWLVAPGFVVRAGPGELAIRVALSSAPLHGAITGEGSAMAVNPALVYRVYIGGRG